MPRISIHGNDRGFVLSDAILCIFLGGIILLTAQKNIQVILKTSAAAVERGIALVEERNGLMGKIDEPR